MSENILYFLEQNNVPEKDWGKVANAVAEWLGSYKKLHQKSANAVIDFLLTEPPFEKSSVGKKEMQK